jgi:KDO2-lipid IV(A) lauroyltransferase
VYLAVRIVVCIFQTLGYRTARTLAGWLARLVYHVDRRHRHVALDNLRQAFPRRYTEAELEETVRATYRHFCTLLAEMSALPRKMHTHNYEIYFDLGTHRQIFLDLMRSNRPVMIVTGHYGNWEMAGYAFGLMGFKTYAVARPLDNPFLEACLRRFREGTGLTILSKKGDLGQMRTVLAQGGKVSILADQAAGPRGLWVDFFGRPASTHKAVALLALQFRVPLIVCVNIKIGEPMRYRYTVADVIFPEEYTGRRTEVVKAITRRFNAGLERLIAMAPEQYFWLHNRWKTYAGQETSLPDAA